MPDVESVFASLLGHSPSVLAEQLLRRADLGVGLESQELGAGQPSMTSTASVLYCLSSIPSVPDELLTPHVDRALSWIEEDGAVRGRFPSEAGDENTWRSAQLLAALCVRPKLARGDQRPQLLAGRLLHQQDLSGGFSYRPQAGLSQPLFTLYPVVALYHAVQAGLLPRSECLGPLGEAGSYLDSVLRAPSTQPESRLLAAAARTFIGPLDREMIDSIERKCWAKKGLKFRSETVIDAHQPLFYVRIHVPALALAARRLWPWSHRIATALSVSLLESFDRERLGWRPHPETADVYSWTTGLGILAAYMLAGDLSRSGADLTGLKARWQSIQSTMKKHDFDVAISFSGEQRNVAEEIADVLGSHGLTVFYDFDHQHRLLGEDLAELLQKVYFRRSRFAIAILSKAFLRSKWAGNLEWRAVLARMQSQRTGYLLPYYWEKVEVPGLNPTIGYISRETHTPTEFAELVARKLLEPE